MTPAEREIIVDIAAAISDEEPTSILHVPVRELRVLLSLARQAPEWRPIEEAPEDELVLIATRGDHVGVAYHVEHSWWDWEGGRRFHPNHIPVAWQPLPSPPTGDQ